MNNIRAEARASPVTLSAIQAARERIQPVIRRTALILVLSGGNIDLARLAAIAGEV